MGLTNSSTGPKDGKKALVCRLHKAPSHVDLRHVSAQVSCVSARCQEDTQDTGCQECQFPIYLQITKLVFVCCCVCIYLCVCVRARWCVFVCVMMIVGWLESSAGM
jgi:hypothetical protein